MKIQQDKILIVILVLIVLDFFFFILFFRNKENLGIDKSVNIEKTNQDKSRDLSSEKKVANKDRCPKEEGCDIPDRQDVGAIVTGALSDGIFYQEVTRGGLPVALDEREEKFLTIDEKTEIIILTSVATGRVEAGRKRSTVDPEEGFLGKLSDFKKGDLIYFTKEGERAVLIFLVDENQSLNKK